MKRILPLLIVPFLIWSCGNNDKAHTATPEVGILEQDVPYQLDSLNMIGFAAYDTVAQGARPVVFVVHEWWGLTDYTKYRVRELAKLGYFAFAIDLFGNRAQGENPDAAGKLAGPFYQDPEMGNSRFEAAYQKAMSFPEADMNNVAVIGYCFGGAQALNYARKGFELKGVVSFHGNLTTSPLDKEKLKADVLVCHGAADPMVPQEEVDAFKKQMDSVGASYTFKAYENATHAFTNPGATEAGQKFNIPVAYNAAADSASWQDMKDFFNKIFKK